MSTQTTLPLRDPRFKRPLAPLSAAHGLLDLTESEVAELVDCGDLVAFDIRSPDAEKRDLRILTASIAGHLAGDADHRVSIMPEHAVELVLKAARHDRPWLDAVEVRRLLNCGRQHSVSLIQSGAIAAAPGSVCRRGHGGSPLVSRTTFADFLRARIL
jgi:hypothetical protein